MKNPKEWKLKHKIILHVVVIGTMSGILLTYLYLKTQGNIIHSMSQQKAELITSMVENSLSHSMKEKRLEEIQSNIESVSSSSSIKSIRILDPQGIILRSNQEVEIGNSLEKEYLISLEKLLTDETQKNFYFTREKLSFQSYRTIKNRNECFECHSPSQEIIAVLAVETDYTATSALIRRNQFKAILIASLSITILTYIIFRLFEKVINRPISQLKENMEKVQRGDMSIQFPIRRNDEIGSLTKSFNVMISKLKEANQKIENLFQLQMEKAEHLASIGELAAGLAHEIKNPIAGMKGALEIINQKTDASDPQKEIFTEILLQIEKIHKIIEDLLSYAKPKEISYNLVNPNECIKNAIILAKPQINNKDVHFHFQGIENNTLARMDSNKIQEVMLNLMLNSISAIKEKGHINLTLQKRSKKVLEIIFSDDGAGIKKEHISQIFNPFFTTKIRGTGLGLSICKKIIEAHKGSIKVEGIEGNGTTFFIQLPVL